MRTDGTVHGKKRAQAARGGVRRLVYPFKKEDVRALRAGDVVSLCGKVFTGRDRFHKHFADGGGIPASLECGALYHCGPVVVKDAAGVWRAVAAGPTTSVRENPYEPALIAATGLSAIIGKGGMDAATLEAGRKYGCVYLQAVGGAAAVAARAIKRVAGVRFLEEFGAAEAMWEFEMDGFPAVVAMDSCGNSLFDGVARASRARLAALLEKGDMQ